MSIRVHSHTFFSYHRSDLSLENHINDILEKNPTYRCISVILTDTKDYPNFSMSYQFVFEDSSED